MPPHNLIPQCEKVFEYKVIVRHFIKHEIWLLAMLLSCMNTHPDNPASLNNLGLTQTDV